MELLTDEIKAKIPGLYSTDGAETHTAVCKFFDPSSSWTWYVVEGTEQDDGNWVFFGLVEGFEREWGYFSLDELQGVTGSLGLGIERDLYFEPEAIAL
jgi:hypothetical protein|tara:strand:- start:1158 stop:1451 length:294 start_codon:yes stop_codon:yes gene_type:complete